MIDPKRGEVWLVDLGMTAKVRPAVVVSVSLQDEDRALATLIPHTTSLRGSRFECSVSVGFLKAGAFDAQGIITVPTVKLMRRLGSLNLEQLSQVEKGMVTWLGLTPGGPAA